MNLEYMNVSLFEMSSIFFLLYDIDFLDEPVYKLKSYKNLEDRKIYPPFLAIQMYYLNYDHTGL